MRLKADESQLNTLQWTKMETEKKKIEITKGESVLTWSGHDHDKNIRIKKIKKNIKTLAVSDGRQ